MGKYNQRIGSAIVLAVFEILLGIGAVAVIIDEGAFGTEYMMAIY